MRRAKQQTEAGSPIHVLDLGGMGDRIHIALVGAGGNGSQMLAGLARLDRALRSTGRHGLNVTIYDPDKVSDANVGRQLFGPADIGLPKAVVLTHRVNVVYGLDWAAVPAVYTGAELRRAELGYGSRTGYDFLVSCVDSARARREIATAFRKPDAGIAVPRYWMDLGNRQSDGQVVLGQPISLFSPAHRPRLPVVTELFPEIMDPKFVEDKRPSCSLAEALESQDLFINQAVSTFALHLLWTLFRQGKIEHHGAFINLGGLRVNPIPVPAPAERKAAA